jgi:hypothetical protein
MLNKTLVFIDYGWANVMLWYQRSCIASHRHIVCEASYIIGSVIAIICVDTTHSIILLHVSAFRPSSGDNTVYIHRQLILWLNHTATSHRHTTLLTKVRPTETNKRAVTQYNKEHRNTTYSQILVERKTEKHTSIWSHGAGIAQSV